MGGFDGWECLNEVEVLDLNADHPKFELVEKLPMRLKNSAVVLLEASDTLLIFGGWDEKETMSTVFAYDLKTGDLDFHGHLPKPVEGHAVVHDPATDNVLIFGGYDSMGVTDRIMRYDIKTRKS
mmetsp:Transcript_42090/g.64535  ORF Transcript_42090/g.64535 Transcript_42090/m.64535 type:complete len:124 (+) Transcript_42090:365-736(+)